MISTLTARAYTPCRTIAALSDASLSLRTLSRRAQHPQALCSASSRASCTWSRDDVNLSRRSLVHTPWKHCGIRPASLFSTSTARRLKLEDEATGSPAPRSGTEVGAIFFHFTSIVPIRYQSKAAPGASDLLLGRVLSRPINKDIKHSPPRLLNFAFVFCILNCLLRLLQTLTL